MKTSRLIDCLSFDLSYRLSTPARSSLHWLLLFLPVALIAPILMLDVRPHFAAALGTWRYLFKLGAVANIGVVGFLLCNHLCKPPLRTGPYIILGAFAVVPIAAACALEAVTVHVDLWVSVLIGTRSWICISAIPLISFPLLIAALLGIRGGAPTSLVGAGSAAGVAAGGFGAFIYAFFCDNDSPFYIVAWYIPAIMLVSIIGRFLGRHLLPW